MISPSSQALPDGHLKKKLLLVWIHWICLVPAICSSASSAGSTRARFMLAPSLRSHPNPFQVQVLVLQSILSVLLVSWDCSAPPWLTACMAQDQGVSFLMDPKGLSLSCTEALGLGLTEADETGREQNQIGCRLLRSQWKKLWCELCHGFLFCCITMTIPLPCPERGLCFAGGCGQERQHVGCVCSLRLLREVWDEVGHGQEPGTGRDGSFGWLGLAITQSLVFLGLGSNFSTHSCFPAASPCSEAGATGRLSEGGEVGAAAGGV